MTAQIFGPRLSDEYNDGAFGDVGIPLANWKELITSPMQENCLAPSDEAIGLAYHHYCDDLAAPFHESEAEMADLYADILGGIADLQIIAPDVLDEILCPDEQEAA